MPCEKEENKVKPDAQHTWRTPPENVRKNCIKRDFTRHKKRAIAQHTKAYVSNRIIEVLYKCTKNQR